MRSLLLSLLFFPALLAADVARAEPRACFDRTAMINALVDDYGEQLAEVHEIKGKGLLEFHVSPNEGTWTALLTDDDGVSCVVASGDGVDPAKSPALEAGLQI